MQNIKGIAASDGVAIAKAYKFTSPDLTYERKWVAEVDVEVARFEQALTASKRELEKLKEQTKRKIGDSEADIFSAHLLILDDPEMINPVMEKIRGDKLMAEAAFEDVANHFIGAMENMENAYMRERSADIDDVIKRVLSHLLGVRFSDPAMIYENVVVIASDLTPSDTAQLNKTFVKGFATDSGGRTSHSAIMARSLEIPAVVGTDGVTEAVKHGTVVIVDGMDGVVIVDPSDEELAYYREKKAAFEKQKREWAKLKHEPTLTAEGERVELGGNIGTPADVDKVLENGGEAVGLYRTEFLYMARSALPTEDEQYEAYRSVLEKMDGKPVVVRTLDVGGDKELDYLDLPEELNPFLGFRAIRFCLENEHIFRPQLRALLRASAHGNLKIMFPMVATLIEFRQAKRLLFDEKAKLKEEGVAVASDIEVGIMVEIPATAIMARQFAKEVDFFSIGTNDLIQYTMAADRMNEQVSYLYQPYNPAILNLIGSVIEAAHSEGKWVGMCGEMAADPVAIPILLGLGLDEFSMSVASILPARAQIRGLSKEKLASYKEKLLGMRTASEVKAFITEASDVGDVIKE